MHLAPTCSTVRARQNSCSTGNVIDNKKTPTAGKSKSLHTTLHEFGKAQRPCCIFIFWNLWAHLLLLAVWRSLLVSTSSLHSKQQGLCKATDKTWMDRLLLLGHSNLSKICVELWSWGTVCWRFWTCLKLLNKAHPQFCRANACYVLIKYSCAPDKGSTRHKLR